MGNKKNGFTRRYCSIPDIGNLRHWFEKNFHNACRFHDNLYTGRSHTRYEADKALARHMYNSIEYKRGLSRYYLYLPTIGLTFIATRLFGWRRYDG